MQIKIKRKQKQLNLHQSRAKPSTIIRDKEGHYTIVMCQSNMVLHCKDVCTLHKSEYYINQILTDM